jgi:hypothetical protein
MVINTNLISKPSNWWRIPALALLFMLAVYFAAGLPAQIRNAQNEDE